MAYHPQARPTAPRCVVLPCRHCAGHVGTPAARRKAHICGGKLAACTGRCPLLAGALQGLARSRAMWHMNRVRFWLVPSLLRQSFVRLVSVAPSGACFKTLRAAAGYHHDRWLHLAPCSARRLTPCIFFCACTAASPSSSLEERTTAASLAHLRLILADAAI